MRPDWEPPMAVEESIVRQLSGQLGPNIPRIHTIFGRAVCRVQSAGSMGMRCVEWVGGETWRHAPQWVALIDGRITKVISVGFEVPELSEFTSRDGVP